MKSLKPQGNDIQMSTPHENRFGGPAAPDKTAEEKELQP